MHRSESAICIHISPLLDLPLTHPPSHPSRSSQNTRLSSLHSTGESYDAGMAELALRRFLDFLLGDRVTNCSRSHGASPTELGLGGLDTGVVTSWSPSAGEKEGSKPGHACPGGREIYEFLCLACPACSLGRGHTERGPHREGALPVTPDTFTGFAPYLCAGPIVLGWSRSWAKTSELGGNLSNGRCCGEELKRGWAWPPWTFRILESMKSFQLKTLCL